MNRTAIVGVAIAAVALTAGCGTGDKITAAKPASYPSSSPTYSPPPTYSTPSSSPTAPDQMDFGSVATATSNNATANIWITAPTFATRDPGFSTADYGKPKNGVYAVFSISAVGVSGSFAIGAMSFYVRGSDGTRYQETTTLGFGSDLSYSNLGPQEPIKGNVVFDLPSRAGTLVYAPGLSALGEWKF